MRWALSVPGREEIGLRIASAVGQFWLVHSSLTEGRRWLTRALRTMPDAPPPLRARALSEAGRLAHFQGDQPEAELLLDQSLTILHDLLDHRRRARVMSYLGLVAISQGDYPRAIDLFTRSADLDRQSDNAVGAATTNTNLARVLLEQGDLVGARALLEPAIDVLRAAGDDWGLAVALGRLGIVARLQGLPDEALALSRQSVQLCRGLDDRRVLATGVQTIGLVALARAEYARAARLLAVVRSLRDELGVPLYPAEVPQFEQDLARALASVGRDAIEATTAEMRSLSRDAIYRYVLDAAEPRAGRPTGVPSRPSGPNRGPLSTREADVAALVAAGQSNQQIAERLVISERTVETHVRNLRTKLGLQNRAAVAAWAATHRLMPSPESTGFMVLPRPESAIH
jgi:DNA-binding CsgD family transcriptional regulator